MSKIKQDKLYDDHKHMVRHMFKKYPADPAPRIAMQGIKGYVYSNTHGKTCWMIPELMTDVLKLTVQECKTIGKVAQFRGDVLISERIFLTCKHTRQTTASQNKVYPLSEFDVMVEHKTAKKAHDDIRIQGRKNNTKRYNKNRQNNINLNPSQAQRTKTRTNEKQFKRLFG